MDTCDSCYSEAQVQIEKTVYDTICGDAVKICSFCCTEDDEPCAACEERWCDGSCEIVDEEPF
jgi:hypothetical protein